ncbi:MAG TPA: calcium-binding protein, partial [Aestuariivirgaceae bacterium]|nr:calcium-binding protein [Aestuariivirgaceae bacterium]
QFGMLRPFTLEDVLIHEAIHAVDGLSDPDFDSSLNAVNADFFGATVQKTNIIMQELNFGYIRSGYINTVPSSFGLTNATFGNSIDFAFVDRFPGKSYGLNRASDTTNLNSLLIMTDDDNDIVNAGAGRDYVYSGNGNDKLDGGPGSDRLEGGADNDTYYFSRTSGIDTIFDTSGSQDTIYYHGNALPGLLSRDEGESDLIGGLSGPRQSGNNLVLAFLGGANITIEDYFSASGSGYGTGRIEYFIDGNEGFINWPDQRYYFTVSGDLTGRAGEPSYVAALAGSTASNRLDDGDSSVAVAAQSSVRATDGPPPMALLASASESDDPFDDWLIGADGQDTLIAHDGDDVLLGGGQNDQLEGGLGNDFLDGGAGADSLDGGPDTANSGGLGDTALYVFAQSGVSVNLATGSGTRGDAVGDTLIGIENLVGSEFADELIGNAGTNLLLGLGGDDLLEGRAGADVIAGGAGDDRFIFAPGGGADLIADFIAGSGTEDKIDLTAFTNIHRFGDILARATASGLNGADTLIEFGNGDSIRLLNV